jgi:putative hydrolase of the HAD superfamily
MARLPRQHLCIDADDTLWENMAVFDRVNTGFATWLELDRPLDEVLVDVDAIQRELCTIHGYGARTFERSLQETVRRLLDREPTAPDIATIASMVAPLAWDDIELIDGVAATLAELAARHDLLLVTKGDPVEQRHKLTQSGLGEHFRRVVVVPEKHTDTYRRLIVDEGLDLEVTWMIGNSPRSDVLPSLEAGLRPVFIPHPNTWAWDHEELAPELPVLRLERFTDLLEYF